ncbi:MAG TPA: hypothetical protein DCQ06_12870 [Myxococcales bacterium]|nr:hypothetical protein [Myxococcales bacterium]HAN32481.1 hypothetical protein [Myxococcales bacterium]|tara:strand:+ start:543 stop:2009 length:1467 start_codon:yes stop_codon:yes gene_type:complete
MSGNPKTTKDSESSLIFAWVEVTLWITVAACCRFGLTWWWSFDGYWGQDPWGYLAQAKALLGQSSALSITAAHWPQGYPALMAAVSSFTPSLMSAGQIVSLTLGSLTIGLLWAAIMAAGLGRRTARIAALMMCISPVHVLWSSCATSDVTSVFWLSVALWGLARRSGATWHHWLSGLALAFALSTRLAVAPALLGLATLAGMNRPRSIHVSLGAALGLLPQSWLWAQQPQRLAHPWLTGWRPWNLWRQDFVDVDGTLHFTWPQGVFAWFSPAHPGYLGPTALLVALFGCVLLWRKRRRLALGLGLWAGSYVVFFSGIPYQNFRFGLVSLIPWTVLSAVGVATLWDGVRWRRWAAIGALLSTVALQLVWANKMLPKHVQMAQDRRALVSYYTKVIPAKSLVYAFGISADLHHRGGLMVRELAATSTQELATSWPNEGLVFILLNPLNIDRQWRPTNSGPIPAIDWLKRHAKWYPVERKAGWFLWRLELH